MHDECGCSPGFAEALRKVLRCILEPPVPVTRTFAFKGIVFSTKGVNAMTTLTVKDTDVPGSALYTVSFQDAKGRKAKPGVVPTLSVDNADVIDQAPALTDNGDGTYSSTLHITDVLGACNITVDDADTTDVKFVDTVSVIPGDAVAGTGSFGPVTPDTPPA